MYFRRINDTTINCIISTDDLSENHIRLDDLFERKREAMDYLRRVIAAAAREENFNLRTDYTSMRITVLPDHSLSLTLTEGDNGARAVKDIRDIKKKAGKGTGKDKAKKGGRSLPKDLVKAAKKSAAVKPAGKKKEAAAKTPDDQKKAAPEQAGMTRFGFYFESLSDLIRAEKIMAGFDFVGCEAWYLKEYEEYDLIVRLKGSDRSPERVLEFEKAILQLFDFGEANEDGEYGIAYILEHGKLLDRTMKLTQL